MTATKCPNCQTTIPAPTKVPQRVATVRMPASLYGRLQDKARETGESLNSLCVTALNREVAAARVEIKDGVVLIQRQDGSAIQCQTLSEAEEVLDQDGNEQRTHAARCGESMAGS